MWHEPLRHEDAALSNTLFCAKMSFFHSVPLSAHYVCHYNIVRGTYLESENITKVRIVCSYTFFTVLTHNIVACRIMIIFKSTVNTLSKQIRNSQQSAR